MATAATFPRFKMGRVLATPGALRAIEGSAGKVSVGVLLSRHVTGDWGDLNDHDKQANEDALTNGDRILSAYVVGGVKFWVITEADRSSTTILLPEEY